MKKTFFTLIFALLFGSASFAQVCDSLEVAKASSFTVESLLLSKVSGVDIASETGSRVSAVSTLIRGVNSLKTASSPLWIVDGIYLNDPADVDNPFWEFGTSTYTARQNSLMGFNVYDIESIEVLKDVSATSLYGSLGANGVIIINTRFPMKNRPIGVQWNSNLELGLAGGQTSISHNHTASLSGFRNNTNYYISGFYKDFNAFDADGRNGGFRFNFRSKANSVVQLGLTASMSVGADSAINPMLPTDADIDDNTSEYRTTDGFYVIVNPLKSLSIKAEVGMDYRMKRRLFWYGISTDLGAARNGALSVSTISQYSLNGAVTVAFKRWFGKNHVSVEAKGEAVNSAPQYKVMCGYDFFDYTLRSKGMSIASNTSTNRDNAWNGTTLGGYARAAYDFDSKAGFDAALRADRNSLVDEQFSFYPSANAFVDLAKIVLPDSKVLTEAKLTAGWGRAGRDNYVPYLWMGDYTNNPPVIDTNFQAFYNGFFRSVSQEFNFGGEFSFLEDKVSFAAKYYAKQTSENLRFFEKGKEFGVYGHWAFTDPTVVLSEDGGISNEGVEIDLSAELLKDKDLLWTVSFNGAYNINKVTSIPGTDNAFNPACDRWTNSNAVSLPAHYLVGYTLNDDGTYYDRTGDGKITQADITGLASIYPKYVFGLSTTLRWRALTFDALLSGRLGASYLDVAALLAEDTPPIQSLVTPSVIKSADCIRPTRATLAYDIPLGRFSNLAGLKVSLTYADAMPLFGYSAFPETKSFIGGICLTF